MNNAELIEFIKAEMIKEGAPYKDNMSLYEFLNEGVPVYEKETGTSRWWANTFKVVSIDPDKPMIGYRAATTTGDDTPYDKGWQFNPDTITTVESYEVTSVHYRPKAKTL